jgi:eukaryotic-like serine/threonine-protein kinase
LIAQAAAGLAAAHQANICHRDIKPDNLMVSRAGQIKIVDFGLAKLTEKQSASILSSEMPTAGHLDATAQAETKPGTILGTVAYMTPEQAEGRSLDHRTDIFSLGILLYELLTGQRPFQGKSAVDVLHAIIHREPPSATDVNPQLPAQIRDVLDKALAKDVSERYQHAGDFELDLRRLKRRIETNSLSDVQEQPASKPLASWPGKRAIVVWTVLSFVLLVGGVVAAWMMGRASAVTEHSGSLETASLTPLVVDPNYDGEPTFSPDGQTIAYVTNRNGNFEIFRKQISGGAEINLTQNASDDLQPAFSPDGTQIAFVSTRSSSSQLIYRNANFPLLGGDIWVMPSLGGLARRIATSGNFPSWSPDGSNLIYTTGPQGSQKILRIPASGGEPREIPLKFKSGGPALSLFYPAYSSDGRWIVFEAQQGDLIYVMNASGGEPERIARGRHPVWNANSTAIVYSSGDAGKNYSLWQVPFDVGSGKVKGEPTPLTVSRGRDTQAAVSRDGKFVAFAGQDVEFNIERMPFDAETGRPAGTPQTVTSGRNLNYFFDVAPDGRAVVYESHRGSSFQIWRTDIADGSTNQLTSDAKFDDRSPRWSPDGLSIAFTRTEANDPGAKINIWLMAQDGANPQPIIEAVLANFRWLPDGRHVVYLSALDRQLHLFDLDVKSSQPLTNEAGLTGVFALSVDSRWIVYQSTMKGSTVDVRAVQTSGGPSRAVVESPREDYHPFLSNSGKWLYFQPDHRNLFRVPGPTQNWRNDMPEKVTNFPESGLFLEDPQISRDGRELFYSRAKITGDIWLLRLDR